MDLNVADLIRSGMLVVGQISLASIGLAAIAAAPPARGTFMMLALTADAESHLAPIALGAGALLVGKGPLNGSLIVNGKRAGLVEKTWREGILLLAAPATSCVTVVDDGEDR